MARFVSPLLAALIMLLITAIFTAPIVAEDHTATANLRVDGMV